MLGNCLTRLIDELLTINAAIIHFANPAGNDFSTDFVKRTLRGSIKMNDLAT